MELCVLNRSCFLGKKKFQKKNQVLDHLIGEHYVLIEKHKIK